MQLSEFALVIPEGSEKHGGYVEIAHATQYTLEFHNHSPRHCDVETHIDGGHVGTWRVRANSTVRIERPVHDTGRFTFYSGATLEAHSAGIDISPVTGLITAVFKPEAVVLNSRRAKGYGGTGLSGQSDQQFRSVEALHYDEGAFVTIHLRLVAPNTQPRPLFRRSTPIPPPVR